MEFFKMLFHVSFRNAIPQNIFARGLMSTKPIIRAALLRSCLNFIGVNRSQHRASGERLLSRHALIRRGHHDGIVPKLIRSRLIVRVRPGVFGDLFFCHSFDLFPVSLPLHFAPFFQRDSGKIFFVHVCLPS